MITRGETATLAVKVKDNISFDSVNYRVMKANG